MTTTITFIHASDMRSVATVYVRESAHIFEEVAAIRDKFARARPNRDPLRTSRNLT